MYICTGAYFFYNLTIKRHRISGESKDALDIHMMFTREAERYYQKTGRKGKIVHLIEGFEIEVTSGPSRLAHFVGVLIIKKMQYIFRNQMNRFHVLRLAD